MTANEIQCLRDSLSGLSNLLREIAEDKLGDFTRASFEVYQKYASGDLYLLGMVIIPALHGEPNDKLDKLQEFIKEYCKDENPISRPHRDECSNEHQALFIDNTKFFNKTFGIGPTEYGEMLKM